MVDFWFNHFNVFASKGDVRWYVSAYEREAIRPHALGQVPRPACAPPRAIRRCSSTSTTGSAPAPDFVVPVGPNRGRKRGLNENYARELMELHTLGVDGGYTQQDVIEVARALHRLDHRPAAGRGALRLPAARCTTGARRSCSATRDPGRRRTGRRRARDRDPDAAPVDRALHRDQARAPLRVGRPAARAGGPGGRRLHEHRRRHPRDAPGHLRIAGVPSARTRTGPRSRHRSSSWRARCARSAAASTPRAVWPSPAPAPRSASRSTRPSRRRATRIAAEVWVNTGALLARMNFALGARLGRATRTSRVDLARAGRGRRPALAGRRARPPARRDRRRPARRRRRAPS